MSCCLDLRSYVGRYLFDIEVVDAHAKPMVTAAGKLSPDVAKADETKSMSSQEARLGGSGFMTV